MKERPILFSGPMVRAILEGRKTQTRRIAKGVHVITCDDKSGATDARCPYGVPGDLLWVKETWRPFWHPDLYCSVQYAADSSYRKPDFSDEDRGHRFADLCDRSGDNAEPWHPSIHMWRELSRLTLEVVSVRVERLQDISEADAIAEGVQTHAQRYADEYAKEGTKPPEKVGGMVPWYRYDGEPCAATSARHSYQTLWDSINGKGSWNANPWVWVVEFRRVPQSVARVWKAVGA